MNARAEDIARALKGRRRGANWVCKCPAHDDHHPSLTIAETRDGKVLIKCWSGCSQDAVIEALRRRGLWEGKPTYATPISRPSPIAGRETSLKPRDPMKPWRNAAPLVRSSPAHVYFKTRGIDLTDDEALSLRFSGLLWHWPTQTKWPAMLARVSLADGSELTTHQTFLEPDGSGKAPLGKQARLFAAGGKTIGGGVWFGEADPQQDFIVAEGIESLLSALRLSGVAAGCAALSEIGIRRLALPLRARRVRIFADHDPLGQGVAAAREAGRRWLAEGRAVVVSIAAKVGDDANDVWRKRLRSHG